jgi:uncharacterized protein (TIGR03435 family)
MRPLATAILWGVMSVQLAAQAPTFEVASVKPGKPGAGFSGGCHGIDSSYSLSQEASAPPLGRCVINDARLSHLLGIAFGFHSLQFLKGGPDWARTGDTRFNIEAKAEDPAKTTEQQLILMLQGLLIERFSLKFHRETIEALGFALTVAKNGPKLEPAKAEEPAIRFSPSFKPVEGRPTVATAQRYSMAMLAELLTQIQPRPVDDETGLTGAYDFQLSWDETDGPSLVTALQEELGLRLAPQKVPVSLFVIDSAEKPTAN